MFVPHLTHRFRSGVFAAACPAVVLLAGQALATPRDSVTYTNVASSGNLNSVDNDVRDWDLTATGGTYQARKILVSGTLTADAGAFGTFPSDARILVTIGATPVATLQPFSEQAPFTQVSVSNYSVDISPTTARSAWRFRFYESVVDGAVGADAVWDTITLTLDDAETPPPPSDFPEVEPNDAKPQATVVGGIANGQTIGGVTTGTSTSPGVQSLDYFRVSTQQAALGIYRHRLSLSSASPGHVGGVRGLTQSGGAILPNTDSLLQSTSNFTNPVNISQWYGFGRAEQIYYRVSGNATTSAPYLLTYSVEPVTPQSLGTNLMPGTISMSTVGSLTGGAQTDTELWIYDEDFNPVVGLANDDASAGTQGSMLSGTFAEGSYYAVVSTFNLANSLASDQPGEFFRDGNVTDFPNVVVSSSGSVGQNVSVRFTDSSGTPVEASAVRSEPYQVFFVRFDVGEPGCPADLDDGTFTGVRDGAVTIDDLIFFLFVFEQGDVRADLDDGSFTGTQDQAVTVDDLIYFLFRFELGC